MSTVDVTIATRNSSKTIRRCLESIIKNIPYRRIVVVDGGSTDDTAEICKSYGAKVIEEKGNLGRVRYVQALNCETGWVVFVDSDTYIYPEWWRKVSRYTKDREVGIIFGYVDNSFAPGIYTDFAVFFWERGDTVTFSNTLVRRDLVLECEAELERTHGGEDRVVLLHVLNKGMKVKVVKEWLSWHDKDPHRHNIFASYRFGQSIRIKHGFRGPYFGGIRSIRNQIVRWILFTAKTKKVSLKLLIYLLSLSAWTIIGVISPKGSLIKDY